ncbi:hypothetical protein Tco_0939294 [Tanacetum coccineum]|uniref:Uncharacterized protein n=1 Tax=Tanacetum coccineum TaxID=301880 RepID=A0ABQ5DRI6_9ASTR
MSSGVLITLSRSFSKNQENPKRCLGGMDLIVPNPLESKLSKEGKKKKELLVDTKNAPVVSTVDAKNDGFQHVVNERKKYGKTGSNNTNRSVVTVVGLNNVHTASKKLPSKAVDIPLSSYTSVSAKNKGTNVPTSSSNIPTSNPYELSSYDLENHTRSGGEPILVQDDFKSGEEVEIAFDEYANLLSGTKTWESTPNCTTSNV